MSAALDKKIEKTKKETEKIKKEVEKLELKLAHKQAEIESIQRLLKILKIVS